jgi:hypothetical protein
MNKKFVYQVGNNKKVRQRTLVNLVLVAGRLHECGILSIYLQNAATG